ncbi:transmembrane protein [Ceratobasidium sp. AG-Ba]|nr:transmembrane protein [Ceratobasidium sp. AG-Ba]
MTSPNGKIIATVVSSVGGEMGLVDKNGNFQIQSRNVWQFVDDKKYAYIEGSGIGPLTGNPLDVHHIETDSPARLAWNGYFIVVNVTLVNPTLLKGDAFMFENGA